MVMDTQTTPIIPPIMYRKFLTTVTTIEVGSCISHLVSEILWEHCMESEKNAHLYFQSHLKRDHYSLEALPRMKVNG